MFNILFENTVQIKTCNKLLKIKSWAEARMDLSIITDYEFNFTKLNILLLQQISY